MTLSLATLGCWRLDDLFTVTSVFLSRWRFVTLRVFLQSTKLLQSDLIDVSMQSLVDLLCFENTLSRNMKLRINEMPDYVFTRYRTIDIGIDRDTMKIIDKFSKNKSY